MSRALATFCLLPALIFAWVDAPADAPLRGQDLLLLVDDEGVLTVSDALAAEGWAAQSENVPNLGFRDEVFWFQLELGNDAPVPAALPSTDHA